MTNKEAIKEIEKWLDGCPFEDTKKAFTLAINAIEDKPKGDLISREALKEAVALMWGDNNHVTESVNEIIDNAPTIEPYCYFCGQKEHGIRPKDDLISREALKIEIKKQIAYYDDKAKHQSNSDETLRYVNTSYGLKLAYNYIDNAPTVEGDNND